MGFLNPWLYSHPEAFYDVTVGTNAIDQFSFPTRYGFTAAPGWDAVSGLGTPYFDKLLQAAIDPKRDPVARDPVPRNPDRDPIRPQSSAGDDGGNGLSASAGDDGNGPSASAGDDGNGPSASAGDDGNGLSASAGVVAGLAPANEKTKLGSTEQAEGEPPGRAVFAWLASCQKWVRPASWVPLVRETLVRWLS